MSRHWAQSCWVEKCFMYTGGDLERYTKLRRQKNVIIKFVDPMHPNYFVFLELPSGRKSKN